MAVVPSWMRCSLVVAGCLGVFGMVSETDTAADEPKPEREYIQVEVRGRLRHGIAAIGGETTGTIITAKGATWELDLRGKPQFTKLAEQLDGKMVVVAGSLEVRAGVEIPKRWIVTVERLAPAPNP